MKQKLDIESWNRKEHYQFFKQFDEPYYGVSVKVDCSIAYQKAKALGVSFYNYYMHKCLVAINAIDNFKYRIEAEEVWCYDHIGVSATVLRADKTFGFSYVKFEADFELFNVLLNQEIARVKETTGLFTTGEVPNVVHFSALPWINFTFISQASHSEFADSCPKFSIGKLVDEHGKKFMMISIHVHHALVDGYHLGLFYDQLQVLLDED